VRSRPRPQRPIHPAAGEHPCRRAAGETKRVAQRRRAARKSQALAVPQHLTLFGSLQRRRQSVLLPSSASRGRPSWPRCADAREERTPLRGCAAVVGEAIMARTWNAMCGERERLMDARRTCCSIEQRSRLPVLLPARHLADAQALIRAGPLQTAVEVQPFSTDYRWAMLTAWIISNSNPRNDPEQQNGVRFLVKGCVLQRIPTSGSPWRSCVCRCECVRHCPIPCNEANSCLQTSNACAWGLNGETNEQSFITGSAVTAFWTQISALAGR
jgi:hypothetical protein